MTDQIYIKASRIRSLETMGYSRVNEGILPEFIGIVNYGIMGQIQLAAGYTDQPDMTAEEAIAMYDRFVAETRELLIAKNHDYDEAWRGMRINSYTDLDIDEAVAHASDRGQRRCHLGIGRNRRQLQGHGQLRGIRHNQTYRKRQLMALPVRHKGMRPTVWLLRVVTGLVFVISGSAKMIDPYGFIYKIEQYLAAWNVTFATDGLILLTAVGISIYEFLSGFALMTGSYKRTAPASLLLLMGFMLPLSIYIAIADPVDDCGCFGDLWIISNMATCLKNIAITVALVYLALYNRKVPGLFMPSVQWIQATVALAYIGIVGMIGYHEQPLLDFRPYKAGTSLTEVDESEIKFIYEKDGEWQDFTMDNLPDSTWTFVSRPIPERITAKRRLW